jgi:hypothetical protein
MMICGGCDAALHETAALLDGFMLKHKQQQCK